MIKAGLVGIAILLSYFAGYNSGEKIGYEMAIKFSGECKYTRPPVEGVK